MRVLLGYDDERITELEAEVEDLLALRDARSGPWSWGADLATFVNNELHCACLAPLTAEDLARGLHQPCGRTVMVVVERLVQ